MEIRMWGYDDHGVGVYDHRLQGNMVVRDLLLDLHLEANVFYP